MITTTIVDINAKQSSIVLNENYIVSIQDRADDKDNYWKSKIVMANGTEYVCAESVKQLLLKIQA